MRILVAHNRYQFAGGEDSVMHDEVNMLRRAGDQVGIVEADNQSIHDRRTKLLAIGSLFYSSRRHHEMSLRLKKFRPDVLHIHNWFPLLSPSIISAATDAGVAVVQTLHNFRMICANANLYRDGAVCMDCVGKPLPLGAALHGCYRSSRVGSATVSAAFAYHRLAGTWNGISTFIAVSEYQRSLLVRGGMNPAQIVVKQNFVGDAGDISEGNRTHALFAGRLTTDKGIRTVLRAWESGEITIPLRILGDGPLREEVSRRAACMPNVAYAGQRIRAEVLRAMAQARFLIFPSECVETFALTILEAFSRGTPVLAADLESIRDLVKDGETGYTYIPGDARDLAAHANLFSPETAQHQAMRRRCRYAYQAAYTESTNYGLLMNIYRDAIEKSRVRHVSAYGPERAWEDLNQGSPQKCAIPEWTK